MADHRRSIPFSERLVSNSFRLRLRKAKRIYSKPEDHQESSSEWLNSGAVGLNIMNNGFWDK